MSKLQISEHFLLLFHVLIFENAYMKTNQVTQITLIPGKLFAFSIDKGHLDCTRECYVLKPHFLSQKLDGPIRPCNNSYL